MSEFKSSIFNSTISNKRTNKNYQLSLKKTTFALNFLKRYWIMPKMKTNSSAKKRFKLTGSGKIKRSHSGARHLMRKKSKKAKNRLVKSTLVHKSEEARVKNMLCI